MKKIFILFTILMSGLSSQAQGNLDLDPCLYPFYHGIASGDPMSDRVIIWTRITPDSLGGGPVVVSYKMATDTGMTNIVAQGSALTDDTKDYTIKFDVTGLDPKTFYFYEFESLGYRSAVGRTRTAPSDAQGSDTLRFGLTSCANLEAGFFNVYKVMNLRNDMDAVLCLGDYIYEYETGGYSPNPSTQRFWEPANEIISLGDYRMRYSSYHLDGDLRRCHQLYPWICVWDDHESTNDSWKSGAENHTEGSEGTWTERKAWAKQAYFEWLPIRETGTSDPHQLYRSIEYGPLADLYMLDTRLHGRDEQDGTGGSVQGTGRELLGPDQRAWLETELIASDAQYQVFVQQVMMAPLEMLGFGVNGDQWDGYPAERQRMYDIFNNNFLENLVVVTGDIHTSWANDLPGGSYDSGTGAGSEGVEFVTPSVTSPGSPIGFVESAIQLSNPHMQYINLTEHGFVILDLNGTRVQGDWFFVDEIDNENAGYSHATSWYSLDDTDHLQEALGASDPPDYLTDAIQPDLCPRIVEQDTSSGIGFTENQITVLSIYPNPAQDWFMIQYDLKDAGVMNLEIINANGAVVKNFETNKTEGLWVEKYPIDDLASGVYYLRLTTPKSTTTQKIIIQ